MTSSKLLKILGAASIVLLVLWLGYLYSQIPHRKAPYAKAVASADTVRLTRGGAHVELHKMGKQWMLMGPNGSSISADAEKVKMLTDGLQDLQLDDAISDRPERAAEFEITPDSGLRVVLLTGQRTQAEGVFGKQAPDFAHIYFKFADSPTVYLARGVILGELGGAEFNGWREHGLITIGDTEIQEILIETGKEKTDLQRSSNTWTANGRAVDPSPIYGLVGQLAHLKADDFVDPASTPTITYAQLNAAAVTVRGAGQSIVLRIGAEDKLHKRFPAAVDPQTLVWLSEYKVQSLLPKPSAVPSKK